MAGAGEGTPAAGFTYDPTTDRGMVRLLITDTDGSDPIFSDTEIDAFLTLNSNSVLLAAAQALDVMAVNEAMVLKVIKLLDLTTNGAAVAKALNDKADALRAQAADADQDFDWAEMDLGAFSRRELIIKEALRDA